MDKENRGEGNKNRNCLKQNDENMDSKLGKWACAVLLRGHHIPIV